MPIFLSNKAKADIRNKGKKQYITKWSEGGKYITIDFELEVVKYRKFI